MSHKSNIRASHWNARTAAPYKESFPTINSPWLFHFSSLRFALISRTMLYGTELTCTTPSHITPSQIYPLTPAIHHNYTPASHTNHSPLLNLGKGQNISRVYTGCNQALYPLLPCYSWIKALQELSLCSCLIVRSTWVGSDCKAESDPFCR